MQLFYHPDVSHEDKQVTFSREESRHIAKVLRKKEGDILHLTNGRGWRFETQIVHADPKNCLVRILTTEKEPTPLYHLHLAVAPTKMNDRYEWFLEKATEIGVQEITPIICDHSERKVVKLPRFERVLQSALKQSLHARIPILNEPVSLSEFLDQEQDGQKFIAHCADVKDKNFLSSALRKNSRTLILIGPEGDFSLNEIETALKRGWQAVSLGNSRLRTETAAIVACHTVALAHEG